MKRSILPSGFHAHKYHALGNDYLVIDPKELDLSLAPASIVGICDRNFGIGSDGILYGPLDALDGLPTCSDRNSRAFSTSLDTPAPPARTDVSSQPSPSSIVHTPASKPADFFLRIFNPDGSEAEKSGNGLRIFSLYLYEAGFVEHEPFYIGTKGGVVQSRILPRPGSLEPEMAANKEKTGEDAPSIDGGIRFIEVAMGAPEFLAGPPEMAFEGINFRTVRVSMGNPHCVLLGHSPSEQLARRIGPLVERHPSFPHRTNVQFLEVIDRRNIRIEIWERGAGYTLASGTSSCAAASAARNLGLVDDVVTVHMPGGALLIDMGGGDVTMTGPAVRIFDAMLSEQLLSLARLRP